MMRTNKVRQKLAGGGIAYGLMAFEFFTPGLMAVLDAAGAEFVVLDMEHSGAGIDTMRQQIAAARGLDIVPLVRVPGCHYHLIAPVLDAGAMGIMVPMIETSQQARQIADWCRYRPDGVRGLAFDMAHDDFRAGDVVRKMAEANARTLVIPLIETATGIANVDAIMATPGVDIGWLGHYDLTDSMGITAEFDDPRFIAAVDALVAACKRHGKAPGFLAGSVAMAEAWRARGFRCLGYGTDISLLRDSLREGLARLRDGEEASPRTGGD
jgi:2-keto-3-deoxy-L-rhamnonate aldolase RhmA